MRKLKGPMADWTLEALLLRRIELDVAGANWQRSGGKGQRPKPIELPDSKRKPGKHSGADIAQRLRNLGLVPAGDAKNPPPGPPGEPTADELARRADARYG